LRTRTATSTGSPCRPLQPMLFELSWFWPSTSGICNMCRERQDLNSEGSRSGLLANCFFGGLGHHGQKPTTFQEQTVFVGLAPVCGKANKPVCYWEVVVFWPWCPRPPKKQLANKPLRDPSDLIKSWSFSRMLDYYSWSKGEVAIFEYRSFGFFGLPWGSRRPFQKVGGPPQT
jgi:hypothetical protein